MKNVLLLIIYFSLLSCSYSNKGNYANDCIDEIIKLLSYDCDIIRDVNKIPNELLNLIDRNKSAIAKYNDDISLGVGSNPNAKPCRMLALFNTSDNKSILFLEEGGIGHSLGIYVYDGTSKKLEYKVRSSVRPLGIEKKKFRTKKKILKLLKRKGHRMKCY